MAIFYHKKSCPMCKMVEGALQKSNIEYESVIIPEDGESDDMKKLISVGVRSLPVIFVDGKYLSAKESLIWIKERQTEHNC